MLSYRGLLDDATRTLYESCDTPRIDAEYLMQHVIEQSMAWLISHGDSPASAEHTKEFSRLIEQRAKGTPIAYLMGYRDFWTLRLRVNKHVLIPRGDTEVLVEQALERLDVKASQTILDLGTGSGAIALSLAKECPQAQVTAVDQQAEALVVAQENARLNNISNVEFRQSDWFAAIGAEQQFELIASNPPYVELGDPHLQQGDLRFEPETALVADEQGLSDLRSIINAAPNYLKPDAWLLLEHGYQQASAVEQSLTEAGFNNIELYADLNHLPRCTAAQWQHPTGTL